MSKIGAIKNLSNVTRTAFVTGATGFLGVNLVRELVNQGWQVTALHRKSSDVQYLQGLGVVLAEGDILDPESLLEAMPERVGAVFHVAGDTSLWVGHDEKQTRINVQGTRHVVDAALEKEAGRFIHTSTTSAFGRHSSVVNEGTPSRAATSPVNYEKSKWQAEQIVFRAVRERGLDAVVLNPAAMFGPFDKHSWPRTFYMLRDGKIAALPPGSVSFNHVQEVVKAQIVAVDKAPRGSQYILGGDTMQLADMLKRVGQLLGCNVPRWVAPGPVLRLLGNLSNFVAQFTGQEPNISAEAAAFLSVDNLCDSSKAERDLGLQPTSLNACLQDSVNWLKNEGLL